LLLGGGITAAVFFAVAAIPAAPYHGAKVSEIQAAGAEMEMEAVDTAPV
jgi:hypothetical protein